MSLRRCNTGLGGWGRLSPVMGSPVTTNILAMGFVIIGGTLANSISPSVISIFLNRTGHPD